MKALRVVTPLAAMAAFAATSHAAILEYDVLLDPGQETAVVISDGSGSAHVTIDTETGETTISNGVFIGLSGDATAAHLHGLSALGANSPPIITLDVVNDDTVGVAHAGTFSGAGTLTAAQVEGFLDGLTYINVHTSLYGGGEIRGQVVPEPATAALAALALGGLVLRKTRQQA